MGAWLDGSSLGKEGAGVRRDERWLGLWNVAKRSARRMLPLFKGVKEIRRRVESRVGEGGVDGLWLAEG